MEQKIKDKLHSINETCTILDCGRTVLYKEIKEGRLKALKLGRRTLIHPLEIKKLIAALPVLHSKPKEKR